MNTIKGENLMIFVEQGALDGTASTTLVPLALATSCSFDFSVDSFDVTSKDSGSWKSSIPGMKGWSMSTDNLYCPYADKLLTLAIARTTLNLYWIPATNTESGNTVTHTPALTVDGNTYKCYAGKAWINNISSTAANNEAANYSVSFTGTEAITASNRLPNGGVGVNSEIMTLAPGGSGSVVVSGATGRVSGTTSDAKITCTISDGVATIEADSAAADGAYTVTIADAGTETSTYVFVIVAES